MNDSGEDSERIGFNVFVSKPIFEKQQFMFEGAAGRRVCIPRHISREVVDKELI